MALELTEEQIEADWTVEKLGDVARVVTGGTPSKNNPEYWGDEVPFLTPSDQQFGTRLSITERFLSDEGAEAFAKKMVPAGAAALTCIGATIGKISWTKELTVTNQQINSVVAKADTNGLYLYYKLSTCRDTLMSMASGSATPIVSKKLLESLEIALPPREEQERVAGILGSVDDKIEANNALMESLEQLVDLQVVQARKNSGELVTIGDLAVQMKVQTLPLKETSGKVLHYSLPAFDAGRVAVEEPADSILSNKFVVNKPVVLFSKLNPGTPRIWMVDPDTDWLNFASTEFVVLEPRPGVDVGSLWAVCRDPRVSRVLSEYARGTSSSHQRVSPKDILSACVVDVRVPEAHTKLIRDLIAENVTLAKTRDLLIRKLIK